MTLRIITLAMLVGAPLCYLFIARQFSIQGIQAKAGNDLAFYLLLVVAILSPLLAPIVTNSMIRGGRASKRGVKTPVEMFQTLSIIQMSYVGAIYVYGFVIFMLTAKFSYMLYFYPIGIAWSFVYWPRREKYTQLLEKLNQP
jgi:hypothetical protein